MKDDQVVPEKLVNPINLKILIILIVGIIGFHYFVNFSSESDTIVYAFSMGIPLTVSLYSFTTSRKYSDAIVYSKAFKVLGIALIGIFLGELTYFAYEQLFNMDPYPSIADVFFFIFYPGIILFMWVNTRFFATNISNLEKIPTIIIPVVITGTYFLLTYSETLDFDFLYGMVFVSATSIALGISIQTALIFRGGIVATSWMLVVIGILLLVGGDTWYYYIELLGEYSLEHPVNIFWYAGYLIILYAIYNHRKSI